MTLKYVTLHHDEYFSDWLADQPTYLESKSRMEDKKQNRRSHVRHLHDKDECMMLSVSESISGNLMYNTPRI